MFVPRQLLYTAVDQALESRQGQHPRDTVAAQWVLQGIVSSLPLDSVARPGTGCQCCWPSCWPPLGRLTACRQCVLRAAQLTILVAGDRTVLPNLGGSLSHSSLGRMQVAVIESLLVEESGEVC